MAVEHTVTVVSVGPDPGALHQLRLISRPRTARLRRPNRNPAGTLPLYFSGRRVCCLRKRARK